MKLLVLIISVIFSFNGYSQIENKMIDDSTKWDWQKYILPIYEQLKIRSGKLNHRISNKKPDEKFIEDIYITLYADPLKIIDPVYGEAYSEYPEMWFEQLHSEGKLAVNSIKDLENNSYEFQPGEVLGIFSNEIDIMVLELHFGRLIGDEIFLKMKFSFTNRDNLFAGDFKSHSKKFFVSETTLKIDELVYLDYQNSTQEIDKLTEYLDSSFYDLEQIGDFEYGWKDKGMKSYKIPIKK